ncbi:dioxygenase family protein [Portibacter marinus]|uniref:dioxygenase family protein n=1 Tax=Portibacter marinus TaxID=2898660 RepID=UPI001F22E42F|nr:catechol 1,2-dioxygenase [Portibacter marinus]
MKRRDFTKYASLGAIAISAFGKIAFNGSKYVADCETTSDILGPFYRPNAPLRNNLVVPGKEGMLVKLKGMVRLPDCTTPFKDARVELWHCSPDEIYDNDSDDFLYRGTTMCDENGAYEFTTHLPVPYQASPGNYRPAHFHMLISAPGYQSLVTQIYFKGDEYLDDDASSSSAAAQNRIVDVKKEGEMSVVEYHVTMQDKFLVSPESLDRIVGKYKMSKGDREMEFFKHEGQLWMKNEIFGLGFNYVGDNTFVYPGTSNPNTITFELIEDGGVTANILRVNGQGEETKMQAHKI